MLKIVSLNSLIKNCMFCIESKKRLILMWYIWSKIAKLDYSTQNRSFRLQHQGFSSNSDIDHMKLHKF